MGSTDDGRFTTRVGETHPDWSGDPVQPSQGRKYATAHNAEAIRDRTKLAMEHLRTAEKELRDALLLASDDYDNNADRLQQIVGTIGLLGGAVAVEHCTWSDYAAARRKAS